MSSTRSSTPEEGSPKPKRRIVDFEVDDDDPEWEDENQQLQGLGTTTHRSRNSGAAVIPLRNNRQGSTQGPNAGATARKRRGRAESKMQALATDLNALETERNTTAETLALKHGMKLKEVRRRMLSSTAFKSCRKVSLYNAKISHIMRTRNAGTLFPG